MFLFSGQEYREFIIYRGATVTTTGGRVLQNAQKEVGKLVGVLAQANSKEKEKWKQITHPVSHKVVTRGELTELQVGDSLTMGGKTFFVSAVPYDVGGLGHFTVIYCSERLDFG